MTARHPTHHLRFRLKPLVGCLATALVIATAVTPACAANLAVTGCLDGDGQSGGTTLRSVVAGTHDGDVVDMSRLTCSTITLVGGPIPVNVRSLTIQGPTDRPLVISGAGADRVIEQLGAGTTLAVENLTIADGYAQSIDPSGGCIYSRGDVLLVNSIVTHCTARGRAQTSTQDSRGGGVYAAGTVTLLSSMVSENVAMEDDPSRLAAGGGIYAKGAFVAKYSTISNNLASNSAKIDNSFSGGIHARGATLNNSIVDHNSAFRFGGVQSSGNSFVVSSTISANTAIMRAGGMDVFGPYSLVVRNSTIALNSTGDGAGGIEAIVANVAMEGSIIASNLGTLTSFGGEDLYLDESDSSFTLTGSDNVIISANLFKSPPGFIAVNTDPNLLP